MPAAFCRKAVVSETEFEVWGDGKQTRSFMFIDDCVEGSIRILLSDCAVPLNLGECYDITVFWCEVEMLSCCVDSMFVYGGGGRWTYWHACTGSLR